MVIHDDWMIIGVPLRSSKPPHLHRPSLFSGGWDLQEGQCATPSWQKGFHGFPKDPKAWSYPKKITRNGWSWLSKVNNHGDHWGFPRYKNHPFITDILNLMVKEWSLASWSLAPWARWSKSRHCRFINQHVTHRKSWQKMAQISTLQYCSWIWG